jgi:hypothetical protein
MQPPKTPQSMQTKSRYVIEVVGEQIAFGNSYLVGCQHSNFLVTHAIVGLLTLPPNLVQKVNHDLALNYSHAVEMFPHRICQLFLALPSFLLPPCHRWRHFPNRGAREDKLVVGFIESCRCIQSIVIAIAVQNRWIKAGPLELWEL